MDRRHTQGEPPYEENPYQDMARSQIENSSGTEPSSQTWRPPVQDSGHSDHVFHSIPDGPSHCPASPHRPGNLTGRPGSRPQSLNIGTELAIACLMLSIIGFFSGFLLVGIVLDVVAVILGILSLTGGKPKRGMAIAGILISLSSVLLTLLFYAFIGRTNQKDIDYSEQIELPHTPLIPSIIENSDWQAMDYSEQTELPQPPSTPSVIDNSLLSRISMEEYDVGNGVLVILENENASDVDLTLLTAYYDDTGKMLSFEKDYLWSCAAHGRAATQISPPYDKQYNNVPYDHYEIAVLAEASASSYYVSGVQSDLVVQADLDTRGNVLASVRSLSGKAYSSVKLSCIFYADQKPIGISKGYLLDFSQKDVVKFYPPYDVSYREMDFDTFEVIVDYACYE